MSNYRAITFFDLDGTLLDAQSKITPEVAEAMNSLKKMMFFLLLQLDEQKLKSNILWQMLVLLQPSQ